MSPPSPPPPPISRRPFYVRRPSSVTRSLQKPLHVVSGRGGPIAVSRSKQQRLRSFPERLWTRAVRKKQNQRRDILMPANASRFRKPPPPDIYVYTYCTDQAKRQSNGKERRNVRSSNKTIIIHCSRESYVTKVFSERFSNVVGFFLSYENWTKYASVEAIRVSDCGQL